MHMNKDHQLNFLIYRRVHTRNFPEDTTGEDGSKMETDITGEATPTWTQDCCPYKII